MKNTDGKHMIRLQIILLLIIGMITINGCGCEESTQRHLFFKIYNEDIAQSGFKVIETNEIKRKDNRSIISKTHIQKRIIL